MGRFRILHVITRFILGGAQENTLLSVLGLRRGPGWEVSLATGPAVGPEGSLLERARTEGIRPIILKHMQREMGLYRDLAAYFELERLIRCIRPHVVHTHSSKAGITGRLAAFHCGVPVIVHTIHGPSFHPHERRWRNALFVFLERWAARRSTALVSVADAMTRQYLARDIGSTSKFITIRSGMEVEPFLRTEASRSEVRSRYGIPPDAFVYVKVSRVAHLKGHEDVIRAAASIKNRAPKMHLLFVGDGALTKEMGALARSLGMDGQLTFTGLLPPERIPEVLHSADALLHASYREGLPRAVVQGGLAGLPAIAYAIDGTPEAVEDGRTGYLVESGEREVLAERMLDLYRSPILARQMGARARARLREDFDWQVMVGALDKLYVNLLQAKRLEHRTLDTACRGN